MTIYVDDIAIEAKGRTWYHLMSDTNDDEIHAFARRLGLRRDWFHGDHYDVTAHKRTEAIKLGAVPCLAIDLVKIRKKKRKSVKIAGEQDRARRLFPAALAGVGENELEENANDV